MMRRTTCFAALPLLVLLAAGCSQEPPQVVAQSAVAPAPAPAPPEQPEKTVEASPAVKALLAEDPDLKPVLSEEEVRATLAAARTAGEEDTGDEGDETGAGSTGEWGRLEQNQKARNEARRKLLEATVYSGPDGQYHTASCDALYDWTMGKDGVLQRVYSGSAISLSWALDRGLRRHGECKPPAAPK